MQKMAGKRLENKVFLAVFVLFFTACFPVLHAARAAQSSSGRDYYFASLHNAHFSGAEAHQQFQSSPYSSGRERQELALNFFQKLFGGGSKKKKEEPKKEEPKKTVSVPSLPVVQTVEKDSDASVVAVFGDDFAQDLAYGLRDAFSKVTDVRIDIHSVRKTGLLYRKAKNPLDQLSSLFIEKPYGFAVVMVGLHDCVDLEGKKSPDGTLSAKKPFRSEGWEQAYLSRVDQIREGLASQERALFWVGLPPVSDSFLSEKFLYLNDLVRARLNGRDEHFVDIWNAFVDEEGAFSSRGPNISGQEKRLRFNDGIRFTKEGRRKLAFFVEKILVRILSQSVDDAALPLGLDPEDEAALKEGRGAQRDIFSLRKPIYDAEALINPEEYVLGDALHGGNSSGELDERLSRKPPFLRVDNSSWHSEEKTQE